MTCPRSKKTLCLRLLSPHTKMLQDQITVMYVMCGHFAVDWYGFCFHKSEKKIWDSERLDRPERLQCVGAWHHFPLSMLNRPVLARYRPFFPPGTGLYPRNFVEEALKDAMNNTMTIFHQICW